MTNSGSRRRSVAIAGATVLGLVVSVASSLSDPPVALAQDLPECSDGAGNAWAQVRGAIVDAIFPDYVDHPYGPESVDSVGERCLRFPPPNEPIPGFPPGPGTNRGDPHIVTQDGLAYDFHGAGDFVLLRSPANDVEMQVRYRRSKWVSLFAGVAIRDGDTTLTIENFVRGEDPVITLDGEPLVFDDIGWYDLEIGFVMRTGGTIYAELTNGVRFQARRAGLTLLTPAAWAGEFEGIQGNGDGDLTNDLAADDGTPVSAADTDMLYGEFFDSWYVSPADSMFTIPFDEATDGPIRPAEIVTLADIDPADVAAALEVCLDAGLTAGAGLEDCIYDVAVTGDPFWAENVTARSRASIPAVGIDPTVEDAIALTATGSVTPDRPEAGAGRIEQRFAADDYAVAAGTDVDRLLSVSEPCADGAGPTAIVVVDDRPVESLALTCGSVHTVPSDEFTLRVIDPTGGTPSYGFSIAPAGVVELGVLNDGEEYSGELRAGDRAVGELVPGAGSRVFVTAFDDADCGPKVRVLDRSGQLQAPGRSACLDLGPVELSGTPPFSIEIVGTPAGSYHFSVTEVAGDTVATASRGQNVDLVVSTPGQRPGATIELVSGERVYIETLEHIDGDVVLIGPDGVELASAFSFHDLGLITATVDGPYTIVLEPEGTATGTQRLVVHDVADDSVVSVQPDDEVELRISTPGQRASATIELVAGDRMYIETVDSIDGDLVITGPDGIESASAFSFHDLGLITATVDGLYTITIEPDAATTGTQRLIVHRVADDTVTPARLGSEVGLRVRTPGQRASASIELADGDEIYIETVERIAGRLIVTDPDGDEVTSTFASQDPGLVTAESAGTYTVTVVPEDATTGTQVLLVRRP
jgi:hypothetical protein